MQILSIIKANLDLSKIQTKLFDIDNGLSTILEVKTHVKCDMAVKMLEGMMGPHSHVLLIGPSYANIHLHLKCKEPQMKERLISHMEELSGLPSSQWGRPSLTATGNDDEGFLYYNTSYEVGERPKILDQDIKDEEKTKIGLNIINTMMEMADRIEKIKDRLPPPDVKKTRKIKQKA